MAPSTQEFSTTKKILPLILATAIFMQMLDSTILNTSLNAIAQDLGESPLHMQNAIISYVLTLAIFMPVSGYLADRFGTRRVFVFSLILFALGSLFCGLSQNLNQLVLSRVLQGLGGSLMTPVGRLALIRTFDKNELLKALNYAVVPALIGPVMGPVIGGYFVDYFSWHWIFYINIPIALVGVVLGLKYMPDFKATNYLFDLKGFLIFGAASLLLSIALELFASVKNTTPVLLVLFLGFLMVYYYYRHALRVEKPLFPLNLFLIRTFRVGIVGNLATRLGISALPLLLPLLIQLAYGRSAVVSGWIIAPMALTAMFGKTAVVGILDRIGYRRTLRVNTTIIGVLIMSLALPGLSSSIYWFVPIIALLGFFNSIQFTSMNTIALADLRDSHTSSGNSLLAVNQQLAIGFGIAFGLLVLRLFQAQSGDDPQGLHQAFRYTFLLVGVLTVVMGNVFRRLHSLDGENLKTHD